jgi:hypothetical protein
MTTEEFIARHPEFVNAPNLVTIALANAALFVSVDVYGDRYELALEYKTAALLASGKYGQILPAANTSMQADYQKLFEEVRKLNPIRGLVT